VVKRKRYSFSCRPARQIEPYVNFPFPAWFIARHPTENIITASHSTELAERWGRKTRNLLIGSSTVLNVSLSQDSQAAGRWSTDQGGEYYAVGVGVGIAGFRADLGIIDDPFGSREDAESKRVRESRWEWYIDDFSARLKPGARASLCTRDGMTMISPDESSGNLIVSEPIISSTFTSSHRWTGDPLGRVAGDYLWDDPEGYDYGSSSERVN
jgi:hypothetical protein